MATQTIGYSNYKLPFYNVKYYYIKQSLSRASTRKTLHLEDI